MCGRYTLSSPGETVAAFCVSETRWGFDEFDVAAQGLTSHHFEIVDGAQIYPIKLDVHIDATLFGPGSGNLVTISLWETEADSRGWAPPGAIDVVVSGSATVEIYEVADQISV